MVNEELTRAQKEKIKTIIGECEICGKKEQHRLTNLVQMLDADWKLIINEIDNTGEEFKEPIVENLKKVKASIKGIKDFLDVVDVPTDDGRLEVHRIKRQGNYSLRNISLLCESCHKSLHYDEPGHLNK